MTQKSYFHNGSAAGDAQEAPYDQDEFARLIQGAYADGMFVLPNQLNDFAATPSTLRRIDINTGRALINGFWYESDATVTVTVAANSTSYNRIDIIVIEINTEAGTGEIKILTGIPEELPSPPPLNTCSTLIQMPLYYVAAVTGAPATIDAKYIYDQRRFMDNVYHRNNYTRQNDFPNGLFMAWCDSETSGTSRRPIPGWRFNGVGTPQSVKDDTRFDSMIWGRCAQYYTAPSDPTEGFETTLLTNENSAEQFTFSMLLQVNDDYVTVDFGGTAKDYVASDTPYQVIIRGLFTGYQDLAISGTSGSAKFGDLRVAQGYCIAHQLAHGPQVIMFDKPVLLNRTSITGIAVPTLTALSTGSVGVPASCFGAVEDKYAADSNNITGLIIQATVNDSGSSGTNPCSAALGNTFAEYLRADISGVGNDVVRYATGIVPNVSGLYGLTEMGFSVIAVASGANTMDVVLELVGVIL